MANPSRPLKPKQIESLNSAKVGTAIKWMSKAQTWLFKTTNGKLGNKFLKGSEVGILTTTGRKSGEPRDSPLLFLQEGQRIVLVASQGGRATNPMWYLNLVANPRITFRTKAGAPRAHRPRRHGCRARRVLAQARRHVRGLRELPVLHRPQDSDRHLRSRADVGLQA